MIPLGRVTIRNPIIASSGGLGFGRGYWWDRPLVSAGIIKPDTIGAVITKTLTSQSWAGNWKGWNPWQVLHPLRGGWVNAFGLTNRGLQWFIEQEYPYVYSGNLIVSITDPDPFTIPKMAEQLNHLDLLAVEVNLSCPNTPYWTDLQRSYDVTKTILYRIKTIMRHPVIIKIGFLNECERENIAEVSSAVRIDAIDMINTIPFAARFPGETSPLAKGGGVSGPLIRARALEQVAWFARHAGLPIIGGGGVSSIEDVQKFLDAGAAAVSIGSAHIMRPWISTGLARTFNGKEQERTARIQETPITR